MIIIGLLLLGIIITFPFAANGLANMELFFTRLESGDIKFIMRGESLYRIIHDVRGKVLVMGDDGHYIFKDGDESKSWLNTRFGLWWIGVPPFARIHTFPITKERENASAKDSAHWITVEEKEIQVSSLRFTFPRPYNLKEVELKDRLSVDVLVVAKFEVVKPYVPVFLFKGRFFENAGSILRAQVADHLNDMNLEDFIPAPKGETNGILRDMKDFPGDFNDTLIQQVGLKLVGISITQYDPSDSAIRDAMRAKEIAVKQGEGRIAAAEADAMVTRKAATAQAEAEERLAIARGARIRETVAQIAGSLGSPDVVAREVGRVLQTEALTGKDSKITTWVEGGAGAQPVLPIGGEKR
jgi:regulator of protease activity HflC (stomatin/prohibitin superfamily)